MNNNGSKLSTAAGGNRGEDNGSGHNSKRHTNVGTVDTSNDFFHNFGVDDTINHKRGMDQRSPHEGGTVKKPSLFSVDTKFGNKKNEEDKIKAREAQKQQLAVAGKNFRELVARQEAQERLEEQQEKARKQKIEEELKRRSLERHKLIHGTAEELESQEEDVNPGSEEDNETDESEEEKIIGDPGTDDLGDTKSCKSLVDTSEEEQVDDKEDSLAMTSSRKSEVEIVPPSTTKKVKPTPSKRQATLTSMMGVKGKPPKAHDHHKADEDVSGKKPSKDHQQHDSSNFNASSPPRFKKVNMNSTNRRQCIRMASEGQGDKTPESNN